MKRILNKRGIVLLVCLALLLVSAGITLAFVHTSTPTVENTFTPAQVSCAVVETVENQIKSNVMIRNTGDTAAYIRVAVVVTWKYTDTDGIDHVYATAPVEGTDYSIDWAFDDAAPTDWIPGNDGYYYFTTAVDPNFTTQTLINTCNLLPAATVPDGYQLSVEIVASAIQAEPAYVVTDQWGVTVSSDGVITQVP